jgi:hypothetical protein
MNVPPLHQAEHLAGHPAHLQRLLVQFAAERVERRHDLADGAITMELRVRRRGAGGELRHAGVGLAHHPFAEVHARQVFLVEVVIEHELSRFAQVDDPFGQGGRAHSEGHVLGVDGGGGVIVSTNPADPAGEEVGVARILAAQEDAVAAKDR